MTEPEDPTEFLHHLISQRATRGGSLGRLAARWMSGEIDDDEFRRLAREDPQAQQSRADVLADLEALDPADVRARLDEAGGSGEPLPTSVTASELGLSAEVQALLRRLGVLDTPISVTPDALRTALVESDIALDS